METTVEERAEGALGLAATAVVRAAVVVATAQAGMQAGVTVLAEEVRAQVEAAKVVVLAAVAAVAVGRAVVVGGMGEAAVGKATKTTKVTAAAGRGLEAKGWRCLNTPPSAPPRC